MPRHWEETPVNHALVETTRPPLYRAIKYWGKKPHNIWREFIESYCPPGGVILDPFAGSAIAAFEAVKAGRKAIAFDLNPLTSFIIEVSATRFQETEFRSAVEAIKTIISSDATYRANFTMTDGATHFDVVNYHWDGSQIQKIAVVDELGSKSVRAASADDQRLAGAQDSIAIPTWYPTSELPNHPSVNLNFIASVGGRTIDSLWTRRNLYVLSRIFDLIEREVSSDLRMQLLASFIQTVHLCSKMVVPRNPQSNRDFSGSWGRPDYMVRRRRLEQNPLEVFLRSSIGRQSTLHMMKDALATFPNGISIHDAAASGRINSRADINYGVLDVVDLTDLVDEHSVDFAITDPPYAGLVRYLPLSVVWLAWLERIDARYAPRLADELTLMDSGSASRVEYRRKLRKAFENLYRVTKQASKTVVTFHHQDVGEFNDLIGAMNNAGYAVEKVTHQYNRRSGEANVANPYGVSGSDFYIRCAKGGAEQFADDSEGLERFVVSSVTRIIGQRNEPTPYDTIFQALWPQLIQAGFVQPTDSQSEVRRVLSKFHGEMGIFERTPSEEQNGDLWWFREPARHISFPDRPLSSRVEDSVRTYLRRHGAATLDEILGAIFKEYPNGLTPNPRKIPDLLREIATPSGGKWRIRAETEAASTLHTDMIEKIVDLARNSGVRSFVGRREQPERTRGGARLADLADLNSLAALDCAPEARARLEMVDVVYVEQDRLECLWEVENSTIFMGALQRASNASDRIPKVMVVPDGRLPELRRSADPLFINAFRSQNWSYMSFTDLNRAASSRRGWRDALKLSQRL